MTRFEKLQRSDGSGASCDVTETWTEMTQVGCGRVKCGGEATSRLFLPLEYVGVNAKTKERNCPAGKDSYLSRISGLERGHFIRFNDFCCWGRKKGTRRKTTVCAEQHVGTSRCMIIRRSQPDVTFGPMIPCDMKATSHDITSHPRLPNLSSRWSVTVTV